jgi:hypothetical protein
MGGPALTPVRFHAVTIAGQTPGQPIDKKCGGFAKINAAKSAGKWRFRRINRPKCPVDFVRKFDTFSAPLLRF